MSQGVDIALRFRAITDSSLRVRPLGQIPRVVCASPSYLKKWGTPCEPKELIKHNCLVMRFGEQLDNVWHFVREEKRESLIVNRNCNHGALASQWGVAGHGIILKSRLDVSSDIENNRLVEILGEYAPASTPLQMLYPPSRARPRRVKALADQLKNCFSALSAPIRTQYQTSETAAP